MALLEVLVVVWIIKLHVEVCYFVTCLDDFRVWFKDACWRRLLYCRLCAGLFVVTWFRFVKGEFPLALLV